MSADPRQPKNLLAPATTAVVTPLIPADCRARLHSSTQVGAIFECLADPASYCSYRMSFGKGWFCQHPDPPKPPPVEKPSPP